MTASTDVRFAALPAPAIELAGGFDVVGRVRVGVAVGATMITPVSWDLPNAEWTQAGSVDLLGFGSDQRAHLIGGAVGVRNIRYAPISPGSFHVGESESVPTIRLEGSYGFELARSVAVMPTLGVQVDVLRDPGSALRPADMLPVTLRIGLRVVALRDVSYRLAAQAPAPARSAFQSQRVIVLTPGPHCRS